MFAKDIIAAEMLDTVAETLLGWVFERVERRHGRVAAWLASLAFTGAIVAIVIAVLVVIF